MPSQAPKRSLSPVRRPLARTRSSGPTAGRGALDSLKRSLSFSRKNVRPSNSLGEDEVNLFLSDMVTKEYCQEKLAEVKESTVVVKMEIEDLLVSQHSALIPLIKSLVVNEDRDWKWIRFVDGADTDDFKVWQEKKQNIRKGFEGNIDDKSKYEDIMTFQCTIRMSRGTSRQRAKSVLEAIQNDDMVSKWTFEGDLYNFSVENQPTMLQKMVDAETGDLVSEVVVTIKCGWSTKLSHESKSHLYRCIQALHMPQDVSSQRKHHNPLRRVLSANAAPRSRSQMPGKRSMRRCVTTDDDEDALGIQRTSSMPLRRRHALTAADIPCLPVSRRATSPPKEATDAPKSTRRATSPPSPLQEHQDTTNVDQSRGRCRKGSLTTNSDHSTLALTDDSATSLYAEKVAVTVTQRLTASASPTRNEPNKKVGSFGTTRSASPVRKAALRRAKSMDRTLLEQSSDLNWTDSSTGKKEIAPDYDWKSGTYRIGAVTSQAA